MGSGEIYQTLTSCPPRLFRELVMKESPGTADVECKSLSIAGPRPRLPLVSGDNLAGTMAARSPASTVAQRGDKLYC